MRRIAWIIGLALLAAAPARADETAALPEGEVLPLADVIERIMPAIEGELGASRLVKDGGRWVYVIGVFDAEGKPQEMRVDAATAIILAVRPGR